MAETIFGMTARCGKMSARGSGKKGAVAFQTCTIPELSLTLTFVDGVLKGFSGDPSLETAQKVIAHMGKALSDLSALEL